MYMGLTTRFTLHKNAQKWRNHKLGNNYFYRLCILHRRTCAVQCKTKKKSDKAIEYFSLALVNQKKLHFALISFMHTHTQRHKAIFFQSTKLLKNRNHLHFFTRNLCTTENECFAMTIYAQKLSLIYMSTNSILY